MFRRFGSQILKMWKRCVGRAEKESELTPKGARAVQRRNYIARRTPSEDICTPPYLTIVQDLENPEDQIFEATVTALRNIARQHPAQRPEIEKILQEYRQTHADQSKRVTFIDRV